MSEQLNSAQLQAIQNAANKLLQLTLTRLQLRKWAVEQALARIGTSDSAMELAQQIYDFVVKDAVVEVSMIDPEGASYAPLRGSSTPDKPF